jgi:hypothetical protein
VPVSSAVVVILRRRHDENEVLFSGCPRAFPHGWWRQLVIHIENAE